MSGGATSPSADPPSSSVPAAVVEALLRAQEEERRQVAHQLHDDAIQVMFGAVFILDALSRRQSDPEVVSCMRELATDLTAAGERLNRLVHDLQPPSCADGRRARTRDP